MTEYNKYIEAIHLCEKITQDFEELSQNILYSSGIEDLNATQAILLYKISLYKGNISPKEIGSKRYYNGTNVTYNLNKLKNKGYLEEKKSDIDKRKKNINITKKSDKIISLFDSHFNKQFDFLNKNMDFKLFLSELSNLDSSLNNYKKPSLKEIHETIF